MKRRLLVKHHTMRWDDDPKLRDILAEMAEKLPRKEKHMLPPSSSRPRATKKFYTPRKRRV